MYRQRSVEVWLNYVWRFFHNQTLPRLVGGKIRPPRSNPVPKRKWNVADYYACSCACCRPSGRKKWTLRPKKKCHRMILFLGSSFSSSPLFLGPVTLLSAFRLSLFFVPDELIYSGSFNASERMFAPLCFPRELEWELF